MGKKANGERARPRAPSFGEFMQNPRKYAANHPDLLKEIGRCMIGFALLAESREFKRAAEVAEAMSEQEPQLFAAFANMSGLAVAKLLSYSASAGAKHAAKRNTGHRSSRYASEHESWHNAALAELREHPKRNTTKMVTAIIRRTRTKASRVAVRAWATDNEKHLRCEAVKAARAAQSLG